MCGISLCFLNNQKYCSFFQHNFISKQKSKNSREIFGSDHRNVSYEIKYEMIWTYVIGNITRKKGENVCDISVGRVELRAGGIFPIRNNGLRAKFLRRMYKR